MAGFFKQERRLILKENGELGLKNVIIEGGCLILFDSSNKKGNLSWKFMITWNKLVYTLARLERWEVKFYKREVNGAADCMSKLDYPIMTAAFGVVLFHPTHEA